jgi:hypothetical protein
MGLRCSCGVRSNPIAIDPDMQIAFADGNVRSGSLTLTINVCEDTPDSSTFIASFVDQSGMIPNRSFVFTATEFNEIRCVIIEGECSVIIEGIGLVTGEITPRFFQARFVDQPSPSSDQVTIFVIDAFASIVNIPPSVQPDLTFFGCPPTP